MADPIDDRVLCTVRDGVAMNNTSDQSPATVAALHRFRRESAASLAEASHVAACSCGWKDRDHPAEPYYAAYARWKQDHMHGVDQHSLSDGPDQPWVPPRVLGTLTSHPGDGPSPAAHADTDLRP